MTLPSRRYLDPLEQLVRDERWHLKRSHGCAACALKCGTNVWGESICGIGRRPLRGKAYCHAWEDRHEG